MRSLLNALLLNAFGDLVAQPIFTYPQALSATEEVGIQWYEAQTYTYTGGLNGYFNSSTTTWDLSGGTFLDRDTLGISYFSDASTMLAEQWPTGRRPAMQQPPAILCRKLWVDGMRCRDCRHVLR